MDEFGLIRKYFAPLAESYGGSLGLTDDAAVIEIPPGRELVVTKDAISQGVHFLGTEDAALIAKKLLRVNLSDLAAMGASPLCYFLAAMLPKDIGEEWVKRFAEGLSEDQQRYAIALAGGDTIAMQGLLSFSVTALGTVEKGRALRRSGARAGDTIYVSGTIGDSALGLKLLQGGLSMPPEMQAWLERRYLLPEPHIALGHKLAGLATACMDVSDGLVQDVGHIAAASRVRAVIRRDRIPLSKAARPLVEANPELWDAVTGGGDDYQLLFTAPESAAEALWLVADTLQLPLTPIGMIEPGEGVTVLDEAGAPIPAHPGFRHF